MFTSSQSYFNPIKAVVKRKSAMFRPNVNVISNFWRPARFGGFTGLFVGLRHRTDSRINHRVRGDSLLNLKEPGLRFEWI